MKCSRIGSAALRSGAMRLNHSKRRSNSSRLSSWKCLERHHTKTTNVTMKSIEIERPINFQTIHPFYFNQSKIKIKKAYFMVAFEM